jgi:alpha-L-rhamnosidase
VLEALTTSSGGNTMSDDERRYTLLAGQVRAAFAAEFLSPNGLMTSDAQAAYSLALVFDPHRDGLRRDAAGVGRADRCGRRRNRL